MKKKNTEAITPLQTKPSVKVTQYKGKTREEKRHQAMLNKLKKLEKNRTSYL